MSFQPEKIRTLFSPSAHVQTAPFAPVPFPLSVTSVDACEKTQGPSTLNPQPVHHSITPPLTRTKSNQIQVNPTNIFSHVSLVTDHLVRPRHLLRYLRLLGYLKFRPFLIGPSLRSLSWPLLKNFRFPSLKLKIILSHLFPLIPKSVVLQALHKFAGFCRFLHITTPAENQPCLCT